MLKFKTNILRKGIVWPQSQLPHSCAGERFKYSYNRSAYSAAGKYVDQSWEYIKGRRPQAGINTCHKVPSQVNIFR
jgi:hypothetical protein